MNSLVQGSRNIVFFPLAIEFQHNPKYNTLQSFLKIEQITGWKPITVN